MIKKRRLGAGFRFSRFGEIRERLKKAGAVLPPEIDFGTLQSYVGKYRGEQGIELNVTLKVVSGRTVSCALNH